MQNNQKKRWHQQHTKNTVENGRQLQSKHKGTVGYVL